MAKMSVSGIKLTSAFGPRTNVKVDPNTFHYGADYGPPVRNQTGVPLFSIITGPLTKLKDQYGALGVRVGTRATEAIEYWHLARFAGGLTNGDKIREGQFVGEMGTTGRSTGIHVHVEHWIKGKRYDPVPFINKQASKAVAIGDGDTDIPGGLTMSEYTDLKNQIAELRTHLNNVLTVDGKGTLGFAGITYTAAKNAEIRGDDIVRRLAYVGPDGQRANFDWFPVLEQRIRESAGAQLTDEQLAKIVAAVVESRSDADAKVNRLHEFFFAIPTGGKYDFASHFRNTMNSIHDVVRDVAEKMGVQVKR